MTFRFRIACVTLAAGVSLAGWTQDKPQDKPADKTRDAPQDAKPAEAQQPKPGEIVVNPISTNIGAQADATKLDAKYQVAAPHVQLSSRRLTEQTRMLLLRGLQAEFVFLRRTFPFSEVGLTLKANTNEIGPDPATVQKEISLHGAAARPGDRGQITDVLVKDHSIVFELNGGPKKKTKWYQRIQIGGAGGMANPVPGPDNTMAHGSHLTLEFDKFVPELTVAQVKQLLAPVFDFSSVSATQAYADIMPPKVKAALKEHRALVGMTHDMVINAKGRPDQKIRESEAGTDYEEWIYGRPPETVEFVRFVSDEVVRIEDMPVGGERVVRVDREVDFPPGQAPGTPAAVIAQSSETQGQAQAQPGGGQQDAGGGPAKKPTLRRAGEAEVQNGQAPLPGEIKRPPGPNRTPSSDPGSDTPGTPLPGPPLPPPDQQTPGIPPE